MSDHSLSEPVDLFAGLPGLDRGQLRKASVLLAGAGNIGSPLAGFLARSGIRLLKVVDRDCVEAKNVATQDYRPEDVGRPKVDVLANRLRAQFPGLTVLPYRVDVRDLALAECEVDLILGALDSRLARQALLSEIAWPLGIPAVDGGVGEGLRGRVQVFMPGDETACLECGWGEADYRLLAAEYPCVPGAGAVAPPTAAPAFLGGAVAAVMMAEAVRIIGGQAPEQSQEIAFDLFHRQHLVTRLRRNPRCRFDHEATRRASWTGGEQLAERGDHTKTTGATMMHDQDRHILEMSGAEPVFDAVMSDFLLNSRREMLERCNRGGLVEYADLGSRLPWLWRLTFHTRGLARAQGGDIRTVERHVVAVRFLPDYLRHVNQFQTLALLEPQDAFHPNLAPPAVCVQVYPGEPLLEIAESLHALFSWRLRQLAENDALNRDACAWGRAHLDELPLDTRPLFGRPLAIQLEPVEETV